LIVVSAFHCHFERFYMNKNVIRGLVTAGVLAATGAHAAVDAAITTAISGAVTDILAVVAIGGAAFVTIAGGGVIWNVASKFVKRLGGKA
jgi:hypothetical protein